MYYLNPKIENLHRVFDQNERMGYLRLDLNENPGGLWVVPVVLIIWAGKK